jgi:hypothetical protein
MLDGVVHEVGFSDYCALAAHDPERAGPLSAGELHIGLAASAALTFPDGAAYAVAVFASNDAGATPDPAAVDAGIGKIARALIDRPRNMLAGARDETSRRLEAPGWPRAAVRLSLGIETARGRRRTPSTGDRERPFGGRRAEPHLLCAPSASCRARRRCPRPRRAAHGGAGEHRRHEDWRVRRPDRRRQPHRIRRKRGSRFAAGSGGIAAA